MIMMKNRWLEHMYIFYQTFWLKIAKTINVITAAGRIIKTLQCNKEQISKCMKSKYEMHLTHVFGY